MRLQIVHSKNAQSFYVVKSILINGKRSSKVVEKLGTYADLLKRSNGEDPVTWAQAYVATLTRAEKEAVKQSSSNTNRQNKSPKMSFDPSMEAISFCKRSITNSVCTPSVRPSPKNTNLIMT